METTRSETLIIVFSRNAVAGRVKTRIGRVLGDDAALEIHLKLCRHTRTVVEQVPFDVAVWLDRPAEGPVLWDHERFRVLIQEGADLGKRMAHAFSFHFREGYRKVMIIGTDCPGITPLLLKTAVKALETSRSVIGPAEDGGYYLLGLTDDYPGLFTGKAWGTSTVFRDTCADLERIAPGFTVLPVLPDIDRPEDLIHLQDLD